MNSEQRNPSDFDSILSSLTARNLIKPTYILSVIAVVVIVIFFSILMHAIFTKLDSNTEYSIQVASEIVEYRPNASSIQSTKLPIFKVYESIRSCPKLEKGQWYSGGELRVFKDSQLVVRLVDSKTVELNIKPAIDRTTKLAELVSFKGRCVIQEKLTLDVKLSDDNPEFIMFMMGGVTVGSTLSYASDTMPSFLKSGEIEIKDRSFWFEDPISLPTVNLSTGDTIIIPSDSENVTMGLLIARHNIDVMQGVYRRKGGQINIVKPFASNLGVPIDISFFERLYSDNALAIALSISFIVIQVLMFLITTLIRLSYIPKLKDASIDQNKNNEVQGDPDE